MEIAGKVVQVLGIVTGQSQRGSWKKQDIIVEQPGQYARKVCLTIFGDKVDNYKVAVGEEIKAEVDIESREFNGKWYTNVTVWKLSKSAREGVDAEPNYDFSQPAEDPFGPSNSAPAPTDDLPF